MSAARLRPERRDLSLEIVYPLAANTTRLRPRVIVGGSAVAVHDLMSEVAAAGAEHRLPSLVSELLTNLYRLHPDAVPTRYDTAARTILLEQPALELRRAEEADGAEVGSAGGSGGAEARRG